MYESLVYSPTVRLFLERRDHPGSFHKSRYRAALVSRVYDSTVIKESFSSIFPRP